MPLWFALKNIRKLPNEITHWINEPLIGTTTSTGFQLNRRILTLAVNLFSHCLSLQKRKMEFLGEKQIHVSLVHDGVGCEFKKNTIRYVCLYIFICVLYIKTQKVLVFGIYSSEKWVIKFVLQPKKMHEMFEWLVFTIV